MYTNSTANERAAAARSDGVASDAQLASVLQQLLNEYGIYNVGSFADCLRIRGLDAEQW